MNIPNPGHRSSNALPAAPRAQHAESGQFSEPGKQEPTALPIRASGLSRFRWIWIIFTVLATSLPYLWNYYRTPLGSHYTWILPPYPEDSLAYLSWSRQAADGSLLFQLKYTALPHAPFLFQPFFLVCGWISALSSCEIGIVHWAVKGLGVALFFLAFFRYTDELGLTGFQSVAASVLVGISSGVGWLLLWLGVVGHLAAPPADLWLVDVNTFWSLLWNPLFPYALALMVIAVHCLDRGSRSGRASEFWLGGLATGIGALIHPYSLPLLFGLALVFTGVRRAAGAWRGFILYVAVTLPVVVYLLLVLATNPLVARHNLLGEMKSPPLLSLLCGFGLPLLICAAGAGLGRWSWLKDYWQLGVWFVLSVGLAYLPVWYQRKLIFGAAIPLCILAGVAVDRLLVRCFSPMTRQRALVLGGVLLLPLLASTLAYLLAAETREVRENATGAYYVSDDLWEGLEFLRAHTRPQEVVFATYETSRLIPAFAGNTVVWGHWAMSVDRAERGPWLAGLFDNRSRRPRESRSREFWGAGIRYFLADGRMKRWLDEDHSAWPLLGTETVFTNQSVAIYRYRGR
jgi:hypothetical protein